MVLTPASAVADDPRIVQIIRRMSPANRMIFSPDRIAGRNIAEAYQAAIGGTWAPVMMATASDIEWLFGSITAMRRPRRWMWMRSATSNTWGILWLIRTI